MAEDADLALAIQLQAQFDQELSSSQISISSDTCQSIPESILDEGSNFGSQFSNRDENDKEEMSLVDPKWELLDPNPDIRCLFLEFNDKYFWGKLAGIEVKWSPRMTLCAGLCVYEGHGGLCSVRLSTPLLKLRPRKDLIETLLHEMIHAYLFVTDNNKDHDGHGPEFHKHMYRLNKRCGTNISVYHTFHDEVNNYRQHWWKCDGPCVKKPPYFGLVKRAMNRAPSPRDPWWGQHQASCGGTYTKIKEPEGYGKKKEKKAKEDKQVKLPEKPKGSLDIRSMFGKKDEPPKKNEPTTSSTSQPTWKADPNDKKTALPSLEISDDDLPDVKENVKSFPGSGVTLGGNQSQENSITQPIVRKIPGFGVIEMARPQNRGEGLEAGWGKTDSEDDFALKNKGKRPLSVSDSDMDSQPAPVKKSKCESDDENICLTKRDKMKKLHDSNLKKKRKRRRSSLDDFLKGRDTPPGTIERIPGFRSTANKKKWAGAKKDTSPVTNPGEKIFVIRGKAVNGEPSTVRKIVKTPTASATVTRETQIQAKVDFVKSRNDRAFGNDSDSESDYSKPLTSKVKKESDRPGTSNGPSLWSTYNSTTSKVKAEKKEDIPLTIESDDEDEMMKAIDFDKVEREYQEKKRLSSSFTTPVITDSRVGANTNCDNIGAAAASTAPAFAAGSAQTVTATEANEEPATQSVSCPICKNQMSLNEINAHLDQCLGL